MQSAVQLAKLQMEFVASVSHELRTPVTAILSAGENIRDGIVHDPACLHEQGGIIATQAAYLSHLVSQVLLHAATGKDKPWHDVRVLRVTDVVESALADVAILLQGTGFTIEREIQAELPLVRGDLSVLSQCLQNLLVNAFKYSGDSRSISISARAEATNNWFGVQISVRDHGVGIGEGDLAHIFEPFYRSSRAVASRIRGTGLGLSIAKRSAEAFGGKLTVVSTEGVGSVFTLHLPAIETSEGQLLKPGPNSGCVRGS
jgi:signal transduction histidine kinase